MTAAARRRRNPFARAEADASDESEPPPEENDPFSGDAPENAEPEDGEIVRRRLLSGDTAKSAHNEPTTAENPETEDSPLSSPLTRSTPTGFPHPETPSVLVTGSRVSAAGAVRRPIYRTGYWVFAKPSPKTT